MDADAERGGASQDQLLLHVLMDVDGGVHPPKDEDRRELAIGAALELAMKQRVLLNVQRMIDRGLPMASGWFRQFGQATSHT